MKAIALIPVCAVDHGELPNKNMLMLEGKLVAGYTIEAALDSRCFDKVVVLTDKLEYQDALKRYAVEIALCSSQALRDNQAVLTAWQMQEALADEYDCAAILAAETPLRTAQHIQQSFTQFNEQQADYLYSINPHGQENGAIYWYRLPSGEATVNGQTYLMNKAGSLRIEDGFDYESVKAMLQLNVRYHTSLLNVQRRIREKLPDFATTKAITLIGHSLWDYWTSLERLNHIPVNNLGIGGITTQQYVELILQPNLLQGLGKYTLIFLGINEMCRAGWQAQDTLFWLNETVNHLRRINPDTQIYLMEVSYMAFKREVSNAEIDQFNHQLRHYFADKDVTFIAPNTVLQDAYRKLDLAFTDDGLHFNQQGYQQLSDLLNSVLFERTPKEK